MPPLLAAQISDEREALGPSQGTQQLRAADLSPAEAPRSKSSLILCCFHVLRGSKTSCSRASQA